MSHASNPGLRTLRSAFLAVTSIVLAATAHAVGGGSLPTLGALLLVAVPVACAAVVLARRNCGPVKLTAFLGASQWAMHQAFSAAPLDHTTHPSSTGHGHGAMPIDHAVSGTHSSMSLTMTVLHVLATAATAWLLTCGEKTVAQMWAWLTARVLGALTPVALPTVGELFAVRTRVHVLTSRYTVDAPRRGPPARGALPVLA